MKKNLSNLLYVAAHKQLKNCNFNNPVRKVGITGNQKVRMGTLSNGTEAYSEIEAIQLWKFPDEIPAKEIEDYIHNALDIFELRTNREWFNGDSVENNKVEEFVELYMQSLIDRGFNIIALHEKIDTNDEEHEIISDDNEKIRVKGSKVSLPISVTINGEKIEYKSHRGVYHEIFKHLVDKNKITKEMCPVLRSKDNKNYMINIKPEHSDGSPFRGEFEYNGLYLECWHGAKKLYSDSKYLIDTFGNNEFILNIVESK